MDIDKDMDKSKSWEKAWMLLEMSYKTKTKYGKWIRRSLRWDLTSWSRLYKS